MMKKIFVVLLLAVLALPVLRGDENYEYVWAPPLGMGRGVVNMCTCWLELPRDMVYYGVAGHRECPGVGFLGGAVWGVVPGSLMTCCRFAVGFLDLAAGIPGNYIHGDSFPTFAWDDLWVPLPDYE